MAFCIVCLKEFEPISISTFPIADARVCDQCFREMNPMEGIRKIDGVSIKYLYEYNDKIKEMIYTLKACGDIELAPAFLDRQKQWLRLVLAGYALVPAPSHRSHDEKRGFNHVIEIFRVLGLPIISCLAKTRDVKQADLNKRERAKIGESLSFVPGFNVAGKRILLVDDIVTTGSTMKACCALLRDKGAKKIKMLALSSVEARETEIATTEG